MQSLLSRARLASREQPRHSAQGGRCQGCGTKIVVAGDGDVVVKNAILRVERASGRVTAKCPRCKAWVEVPLRYVG
ncbi:MAG TPA: hypothetical protein VFS98_04825 [Methylomirabilota bacterium]|nr:hypothetical protein [Methylomirabilota bacterium]